MSALPGDPSLAQLAAADQNHAAVRVEVDRLVARARAEGVGGTTADWIRIAHDHAVDAADKLTSSDHDALEAAALGIAAEAVLRLARDDGQG